MKLAPSPPLHSIGVGCFKFSERKEVIDLEVCVGWKIFEHTAYRVRLVARLDRLTESWLVSKIFFCKRTVDRDGSRLSDCCAPVAFEHLSTEHLQYRSIGISSA